MLHTKLFCIVSIIMMLVLLMAGCSGEPQTTDDTSKATTDSVTGTKWQPETDPVQSTDPAIESIAKVDTGSDALMLTDVSTSSPEPRNGFGSRSPQSTLSLQNDRDNSLVAAKSSRPAAVGSLRVWNDRDGLFSTNAELLEISLQSRAVKLLKENGVAITVPFELLSIHDRRYLVHVVAASARIGDSIALTMADFPR